MLGFVLRALNKTALHTETIGNHTHLVIEEHARVATHFKVAATADAATTIIVSPKAGKALVITDIIVSQDKVASGAITLQFTDGTNTEILFKASTVDAPVALAHGFAGRMSGWKDARVEMISAGTNPATDVTIAYYHLGGENVLTFDNWDAER